MNRKHTGNKNASGCDKYVHYCFYPEDVLKDGQLAGTAAVQNGRVYEMPSSFEAWDSPVPSGILGCMWLSSILHADSYPFDEFREEAAEFYREFYGVESDPALITR